MVTVLKTITKLVVPFIIQQLLVYCFCLNGVFCTHITVLEGDDVTVDCGFQTNLNGENLLLWQVLLNGSEIPFGHTVPGDHFCGIDTIDCTLHDNGSVTLFDVTVGDGDKYLRCLRGDEEGYHYFSDLELTVLSKDDTAPEGETQASFDRETVHFAWSFQDDDGIIYAYWQPVCRNRLGMNLNVSCTPASGELVQEMSQTIDCTCYDSSGGLDTVKLGVRGSDCPAITYRVCWIVLIVAIFLPWVVHAAAILVWFIYKRRDARNADNEKQESTPGSPKGDRDVHTDQEDESGKLLAGKSKEDDSETNKGNSGVKLHELKTQRDTPERGTIPVPASDDLLEKNGESYVMQNGHTETDLEEKYNHLDARYRDYVTAINTTLKQKDETIEELRKKCEKQKQKFQKLSLKYAQMSDKILRSTSRTDEPDVASQGTVSVSEAYDIGEHRGDKQFHLTFSLESPGLKIVLSSCQVGEGIKFELEFKDGKIETIMFGEKHPEYIQCSHGTVKFDLILDGCQLSLHEQSSDGAYPLMEHEHKKFNLCSFLNTIKLNNSCVFTILRCDKLTARHW